MTDVPAEVAREAFMRWRWDPDGVQDLRRVGDAVGWTRTTAKGERWATAFGPVGDVCSLLSALDTEQRLDGITCAESTAVEVFRQWPARDPGHWAVWELAEGHGERVSQVREIPRDDPGISELMTHSASAHILPGDPRIVRWLGIVEQDRLVSVAGHMRGPRGSAHIVGVCTHPDARGQGLARRVVSDLVARAREQGCVGIFLEMYTNNDAAATVYSGLGFREAGRYCSWTTGIHRDA
ncbi:MAG: GNAT family N-acetyltransferase [Actinobacteria bacterium]|nr:GNAT family N-acetyltransferase [Actinomycetota bacterium]